jgi:hypothetical protein
MDNDEKIKSDEDEIIFDGNLVVIVIEGGMVTKVYSDNANGRYVIVDLDNRKIGDKSISEHTWPDTQFDDEKVEKLLKPDA